MAQQKNENKELVSEELASKKVPPQNPRRGVKPWFYFLSMVLTAIVVMSLSYLTFKSKSPDLATQEEIIKIEESLGRLISEGELSNNSAIGEVYNILKEGYIENLDDETLIEGAITGMAEAVDDPYTEYLDHDESENLEDSVSGTFEGIGAEVMKDGEYVKIISPIGGSPAEKAGLMANDLITDVDGKSISKMNLSEAVSLIRGPEGTEVVLTIIRGEQSVDIPVIRESIPIETVFSSVSEKDATIGIVRITNFSDPTYDELVTALRDFENQGITKVVFDVRGNPGGLLNSAIKIGNIFREEGQPIVYVEDNQSNKEEIVADDQKYGEYKFTGDAVMLIDEGSASASEILAGVFKAAEIPLVGTTTFGKGSVQSIISLRSNGELKFTSARWLTADDVWINKIGIRPDYRIVLPAYTQLLYINPSVSYKQGNNLAEIQNINAILKALNYETLVSNLFSKETEAATRAFQADHGIPVDGIVTGDTSRAMVDALREKIAANDTQMNKAIELLQK